MKKRVHVPQIVPQQRFQRRTPEEELAFRKLAELCGIYIGPKRREWHKGFHWHERKCDNVARKTVWSWDDVLKRQ